MNGNNDLIVEFDGVSLNYHDAQGETAAISNLSFSVKKGEFVRLRKDERAQPCCGHNQTERRQAEPQLRQAGIHAAAGSSAGLAHGGRQRASRAGGAEEP